MCPTWHPKLSHSERKSLGRTHPPFLHWKTKPSRHCEDLWIFLRCLVLVLGWFVMLPAPTQIVLLAVLALALCLYTALLWPIRCQQQQLHHEVAQHPQHSASTTSSGSPTQFFNLYEYDDMNDSDGRIDSRHATSAHLDATDAADIFNYTDHMLQSTGYIRGESWNYLSDQDNEEHERYLAAVLSLLDSGFDAPLGSVSF